MGAPPQRQGQRSRAGAPYRRKQYTSIAFTDRLATAGAQPSAGTVGDSYDDALAESGGRAAQDRADQATRARRTAGQVELATLNYVDWYNQRRLFEVCGDILPAELEAAHYRQRAGLPEAS